jgi:hypothetical protein
MRWGMGEIGRDRRGRKDSVAVASAIASSCRNVVIGATGPKISLSKAAIPDVSP